MKQGLQQRVGGGPQECCIEAGIHRTGEEVGVAVEFRGTALGDDAGQQLAGAGRL
jgi:hypothetical protein